MTMQDELPIARGDYVHITPHFMKKPFFAYVEAVVGDRVICLHWSYGYVTDHDVSEVKVVLKKAALEVSEPTASAS